MAQQTGIRTFCRQTSPLTRTSSAVLTDVPGLSFALPANSIFFVDVQIGVTAAATPGEKTALVGQDTGTIETWFERITAAAISSGQAQSQDGGANAITGIIRYRGIVRNITAVAATCKLQAAQSVSDVSGVVFEDGFISICQLQ